MFPPGGRINNRRSKCEQEVFQLQEVAPLHQGHRDDDDDDDDDANLFFTFVSDPGSFINKVLI